MRPARNQFNIYYDLNKQRYVPDFVVETASGIYLVETKKAGDINSEEVRKKTQAALNYCAEASKYSLPNGGKQWRYVLVPHDAVMHNMSFSGLSAKHIQSTDS